MGLECTATDFSCSRFLGNQVGRRQRPPEETSLYELATWMRLPTPYKAQEDNRARLVGYMAQPRFHRELLGPWGQQLLGYGTQSKSLRSQTGERVQGQASHLAPPFICYRRACSAVAPGKCLRQLKEQNQTPLVIFPRKSMSAKKKGRGQGSHGGLRLPSTSVST